jgi:uncharacterized protein (TIGR03437 family)
LAQYKGVHTAMTRQTAFQLLTIIGLLTTSAAAQQQQSVAGVTLRSSGTGNGCCSATSGETQGTLAPFPGNVAVAFSYGSGLLELLITMPNSDLIRLSDTQSKLADNSASGTAVVNWGTGAFNGLSGTILYQINCLKTAVVHACETKNGVPYDPVQAITIAGTGTFYLPPLAVALIPASATSSGPPPGSTLGSYHFGMNGGQANVNFQAPINPSSGGGSAVPERLDSGGDLASATPTAAAAITITPPWQPVDTTYTVSTTCPGITQPCWLSAPQTTGTIPAFSSVPITVKMAPSLSSAGVLPGRIVITEGSSSTTSMHLPLNAIISPLGPMLALSQTGLRFQTVTGTSSALTQSIAVTNQGSAQLTFSAAPSTAAGGNWLSVSASSGTVAALSASNVTIQADPEGLEQGTYFGRVDFLAPGVLGAPQSLEVVLNVAAADATAAPVISPTGLIFVGANPAAQTLQIVNPSNEALTVTSTVPVGGWLSLRSDTNTATSAQPLTETVAVSTFGLTPGLYQTSFKLQVAGTIYTVPVVLIFNNPGAACTPTRLLPVITTLADGFETSAGVPVPIEAQIVDDCGSPFTNGTVNVAFSSDPGISLISIGNGTWAGTWNPQKLTGETATVQLIANEFAPALSGSAGFSGTVAGKATAPVIYAQGGVVSAASLAANAPLAPGSFVSIFGSNLADAPAIASSLPLPTTLANTQVLLGGKPMPMNYAGPGQINAIVPYDVPTNNMQQIMVLHHGIYTPAQTLVVASTQPAVFTQDGSGTGAGIVVVVKPDGTSFENTSATPASAGDSLVIYCAGLGAVNPAVTEGSTAPTSPLSRVTNPVTVSIAGETVQPAFAGLAPGFAGLYQVNVTVPAGLTPGSDVPLTVSAGNLISPPVTVAIQ